MTSIHSPVRYLCIDLGDKRTGLAVGDDITALASPLCVLEIPRAQHEGKLLLDAITRAIDEHLGQHDQIVVGLPLNMDGSEGPRAKLVREFVTQLAERTSRTIHLCDERLSSVQANWDMSQTGMTHKQKKKKRDALAAAAILREFLTTEATKDMQDENT